MERRILNLSIGMPNTVHFDGESMQSAIGKRSVDKAYLARDAFRGDGVGNPEFHGGSERAVCLYAFEHYAKWEREYGVSLGIPSFGENITVPGMTEEEVAIGNIYRLGDAVVQVSQGRIPCDTISKHNGLPSLLKRVVETGFTGYFFRVLDEGAVSRDASFTLLKKHPLGVSIMYANRIYFHDTGNREGIKRVLAVAELASVWRDRLSKRLELLK